jgi:hypothetical protein
MARRYKVEWELGYRMRATTYATIEAANREIHARLSKAAAEHGSLEATAALWDEKARTWTTFQLVPGGHTRGGGRMNPVLHRSAGA